MKKEQMVRLTERFITPDEILQFEAANLSQGSCFVSFTAETPVRHNKTAPTSTGQREPIPYSNLRKFWWGVYSIGGEYEDRVHNRMKKESGTTKTESQDKFQAERSSGKVRVYNPYLERNSRLLLQKENDPTKYYLRIYVSDNTNHQSGNVIVDNSYHVVTLEELEPWLPKKSDSRKQSEAGVETTVKPLDVTLSNVRHLKVGENRFFHYGEV